MGWESEPRDSAGRWTNGGGAVGNAVSHLWGDGPAPDQKARMRGMLKEIQTEHSNLAGQLSSGTISNAGVDRLNTINDFVKKNADALKKLK